jgi:hypothetical protein
LACTVNTIVPLVVPEVADEMLIQESLEAVQEHDVVSVVVNGPPPAAWTDCVVGFSV